MKISCLLVIFTCLLPFVARAENFILSFQYDLGQLERYYIHIIDNDAVFFKYHEYDFVYSEHPKAERTSELIHATLSNEDLIKYQVALQKLGLSSWGLRYQLEKSKRKTTKCHAYWRLMVAIQGKGVVRDGWCAQPKNFTEFIETTEKFIREKATKEKRISIDDSVERPIR